MTLGDGNNRENSNSTPLSTASSDSSSSSMDTEQVCNNPQHEIMEENYRRAMEQLAEQQRINAALARQQRMMSAAGQPQRTDLPEPMYRQYASAESNADRQGNQQGIQQGNQQGTQQGTQQGNQQGDQQENQQGDQGNKPTFDYNLVFEQYMQDRGYPYRDATAPPERQARLRYEEEALRQIGLNILGWEDPTPTPLTTNPVTDDYIRGFLNMRSPTFLP